jgi:glutathione S-transferase
LNGLYERLQENPAVRFALAIEHQEEAKSTGGFLGHVSLDEALGSLRKAA